MEKNAKELSELLSAQLDALKSQGDTAVKVTKEINNTVGKILKLASLEVSYAKERKVKLGKIPALERD